MTGKIYSNSPSAKINKNKVGTYVYYFENDISMTSNNENIRKIPKAGGVNKYNVQRETISPTSAKLDAELFKSQLINEKSDKSVLMNFDM